jgi:DNA ligase-associated metallophosphoesterase
MTAHAFTLYDTPLRALPSGALHIPGEAALCVSDLHLGKSDRIARRGGGLLPPYEARETLARLEADIFATNARQVICLGDSFDDLAAQDSLGEAERLWLARLQAGRRWIWIEGNHDPGPVELGGSHLAEMRLGALVYRHIAQKGAEGEVSGHYHPKHRVSGAGPARAAFIYDQRRLILPAYGTYTGGLSTTDPAISALFKRPAIAVLTGSRAIPTPL